MVVDVFMSDMLMMNGHDDVICEMHACFTFLLSDFYAYISAIHMNVLHYCVRC